MDNNNPTSSGPRCCAARPRRLGKGVSFAWFRNNLFATPKDSVLTIIAILLLAWFLPPHDQMAVRRRRLDRDGSCCLCDGRTGRHRSRMAGPAPAGPLSAPSSTSSSSAAIRSTSAGARRWSAILFVALLVPMLIPKVPYKGWNAVLLFAALPIVAFVLLRRRRVRARLCRDPALGRPDGHAHSFLCRHLPFPCLSASCWRSAGDRTCRSSG